MSENIFITSALPYSNNEPHLGNVGGCLLPADIFCRFMRLIGHNVKYICGTDEYGTATETKAKEANVTPRELCDRYHAIHKKIYEWFNIDFDAFGRTSTPNPKTDDSIHTKITQDIFRELVRKKIIVEKEHVLIYCEDTNETLSDRYVKGTCPKCLTEGANGDQCENCDAVYSPSELINPYHKDNKKYKLVFKKSDELFLRLSVLKDEIVKFWSERKDNWTNVANVYTKNALEEPRDIWITRDLEWGTSVPDTEEFGDKYKNKVLYVWFDAPIGYISITANSDENWKDWWCDEKVKLYNFMAKDNVQFHSVIFPTVLMGCREKMNFNLVDVISASDYINYDGKKFSKTNGTGVFGTDVMKLDLSPDLFRFYLTRIRPETSDSQFVWSDFQEKINSELVNNFCNLVNRVLNITFKNFGFIPKVTDKTMFDELNKQFVESSTQYRTFMNETKLREGLMKCLEFSKRCNIFIDAMEPWKVIKEPNGKESVGNVMGILCHHILLLINMIQPFIPGTACQMRDMLGCSDAGLEIEINQLQETKVTKPKIIHKRIPDKIIQSLQKMFE